MKFEIREDFGALPTDVRQSILNSARKAMQEQQQVYYQGKHFTNFDELNSYITETEKAESPTADWPGERLDG